MVSKRRRKEGKTDYKARASMLKGEKARIIFRKTNKYIIGQYVKSRQAQDYTITGMTSKELLDYGWPVSENIKSIPACYLAGFLLGKKIIDKEEKAGAILDIGLLRNISKSKIYGFLKGLIDAGIEMKTKQEVFPEEKRLMGRHLKKSIDFIKIKENIEKKFK